MGLSVFSFGLGDNSHIGGLRDGRQIWARIAPRALRRRCRNLKRPDFGAVSDGTKPRSHIAAPSTTSSAGEAWKQHLLYSSPRRLLSCGYGPSRSPPAGPGFDL